MINAKHLPNIGQKIYTLKPYPNYHLYADDNIVERIITGVAVDSYGSTLMYLNFDQRSYVILTKRDMWFSRKRAENVFNQRQKQFFSNEDKKFNKHQTIIELQDGISLFEKDFIDRDVLIKVGSGEKDVRWIKARCKGVKLNETNDGYALKFQFNEDYLKNIYLLDKKNITWRFADEQ